MKLGWKWSKNQIQNNHFEMDDPVWRDISKGLHEIMVTLSNVKRKLCKKRINVFGEIIVKRLLRNCLYVLVLERARTYSVIKFVFRTLSRTFCEMLQIVWHVQALVLM